MDEGKKKTVIIVTVIIAAVMLVLAAGIVWYKQTEQARTISPVSIPAVVPAKPETAADLEKELNSIVMDDVSEDFSPADTEGL